LLINTSPEPVSNWGASVGEDLLVIAGLWTALNHPVLFIIALIAFIALMIWLLPRLWRLLKALFRRIGSWLGLCEPPPPPSEPQEPVIQREDHAPPDSR
jgi:hypothetical protein